MDYVRYYSNIRFISLYNKRNLELRGLGVDDVIIDKIIKIEFYIIMYLLETFKIDIDNSDNNVIDGIFWFGWFINGILLVDVYRYVINEIDDVRLMLLYITNIGKHLDFIDINGYLEGFGLYLLNLDE